MTPPLGVIEGYYGRPWSWDMREAQARSWSATATPPASTPSSPPRPTPTCAGAGARSIRPRRRTAWEKMAAAWRPIGVGFGVGLSPYEAYRDFGEETKAALARKLAFFDAAGVHQVGDLFDDMKGDQADLAEAQVRMAHFARPPSPPRPPQKFGKRQHTHRCQYLTSRGGPLSAVKAGRVVSRSGHIACQGMQRRNNRWISMGYATRSHREGHPCRSFRWSGTD